MACGKVLPFVVFGNPPSKTVVVPTVVPTVVSNVVPPTVVLPKTLRAPHPSEGHYPYWPYILKGGSPGALQAAEKLLGNLRWPSPDIIHKVENDGHGAFCSKINLVF